MCEPVCVMCGCTHVYVGETLSCLPGSHDLPITAPALRVVVKQTQAPLTAVVLKPMRTMWNSSSLRTVNSGGNAGSGPENSRAQMVRAGSGLPRAPASSDGAPSSQVPSEVSMRGSAPASCLILIIRLPPYLWPPGPHARLPGAPGALLGGPRCRGRGACAFSWS